MVTEWAQSRLVWCLEKAPFQVLAVLEFLDFSKSEEVRYGKCRIKRLARYTAEGCLTRQKCCWKASWLLGRCCCAYGAEVPEQRNLTCADPTVALGRKARAS